jgi:hypothetical protein
VPVYITDSGQSHAQLPALFNEASYVVVVKTGFRVIFSGAMESWNNYKLQSLDTEAKGYKIQEKGKEK